MKVLVTGGAGYIGSTISSALLDKGHEVVILDSFVKGRREFAEGRNLYEGDIADSQLLDTIFSEHPDIFCTIHCAALIVVPESVENPYKYYTENVVKSIQFFKYLVDKGYPRIVFSSSASVYGNPEKFQVTEDMPMDAGSPYARTKQMMEQVLQDFSTAYPLQAISLRYFNPIGADPKMRSGLYDPAPTHIMGILVDVAAGRREKFTVTGVDWPTRDGSGIRDYIHVWDLAQAHVLAVENFTNIHDSIESEGVGSSIVINLGTENGVTVKELVKAFEDVYGQEINKDEAGPRPGDVAGAYASCDRAQKYLGWKTQKTLEDAISDALKWNDARKEMLGF